MYDSMAYVNGTSGKTLKRNSYILPNVVSSVPKHNNAVPTFTDMNNMMINGSFEYIGNNNTNNNTSNNNNNNNNSTSFVSTNGHIQNAPVYMNTPVYPSEVIYTKTFNNKGKGVVSSMKNIQPNMNNCSAPGNCLTGFPCLKKTNKHMEPYMKTPNRNINNPRYTMKNTCITSDHEIISSQRKIPTHIRASHENLTVKETPNYEPTANVYTHHPYVMKPSSIEQFPNIIQPTQHGIKYTSEGYNSPNRLIVQNMKREELAEETNKQNYLNKSNINDLIEVKDKKIKELEKSIMQENALNSLDDTVTNNKLKEKILDQKTKYEETLKYVKKLEVEKRNLKKSLNVRDKVLNKLENEIGSVDNENDFLIKAKENTNLQDIHNVFKYLHGDGKCLAKKNVNKKGKAKCEDDKEDFSELYSEENEMGDVKRVSLKKKTNKKNLKKKSSDKDDVYTLKSIITELEKEIQELKTENKNVNFKYENTFKTLSELRKDALEYMESIVSRDTRIAYMETSLQKCEKDLSKLRENNNKQRIMYETKLDQCSSEIKVLEKQSSHLQEMIQEKDTQIVLLKSDIVRNETLIKQYEERNKELQSELQLMCNNLESVIEASNKKDLYMNELEKQLRENEVTRQHAYLKELAKNRKVHTDMKFKEILYDNSVKSKINEVHHLKQELYINNLHVQKAKNAFDILQRAPKLDCLLAPSSNTDYDFNNTNLLEECKNEQTINTEENVSLYTNEKNKINKENNEKNVKALTLKAKNYAETATDMKKMKSLEKSSKN